MTYGQVRPTRASISLEVISVRKREITPTVTTFFILYRLKHLSIQTDALLFLKCSVRTPKATFDTGIINPCMPLLVICIFTIRTNIHLNHSLRTSNVCYHFKVWDQIKHSTLLRSLVCFIIGCLSNFCL